MSWVPPRPKLPVAGRCPPACQRAFERLHLNGGSPPLPPLPPLPSSIFLPLLPQSSPLLQTLRRSPSNFAPPSNFHLPRCILDISSFQFACSTDGGHWDFLSNKIEIKAVGECITEGVEADVEKSELLKASVGRWCRLLRLERETSGIL